MIGQYDRLSLFSPAPLAAAGCDWSSRLAAVPAEDALAAARSSVSAPSAASCRHLGSTAGGQSPEGCGDTEMTPAPAKAPSSAELSARWRNSLAFCKRNCRNSASPAEDAVMEKKIFCFEH